MAVQDLEYLLAPDGVTDKRFLRARSSFWEYCKLRNPKFFRSERKYLKELANCLQDLYEGNLINPTTGEPYKKMMMNLPPRHGKSYTLTLYCQWLLGKSKLFFTKA